MTTPAQAAADVIKSRSLHGTAETAVILGRDFQGLADLAQDPVVVPYSDLPGFPETPDGEVVLCEIEGAPTLLLKGAPTFYETGDPSLMAGAIETLTHLGVRGIWRTGLVTSLRADFVPGTLVAITDHINFSGMNPLIGVADAFGVNLNDVYDKRLLRRVKLAATSAAVSIHEGVLMWCSGPTFETLAEAKAAKLLGADLIGWSIAPEAIIARRFGLPFLGVALVTDLAAGVLGAGAPSANLARGPIIAGLISTRRLLRSYLKQKG